ncbi:hypothetical protein CRUP_003417 [Coryphaenoides rupestris]|nr:hypothetical protein CRUP_003417 [Coryphaenoides rupestris]
MGGCVGSHHDSSGSLNENSDGTGVALGRNQPLKRERPKWKSDYPMTEGQLRSKRDEFWDTAPAFEGRKEIWDALRAAASAFESSDHMLAQAILDGASITLPHDPDSGVADPSGATGAGGECLLRLRLSTGRDLRLAVCSSDTVGAMKRRLQAQEGVAPTTQRWFFSGRPLTDRLRLDQLNISRDYVVQVIISQQAALPGRIQAGGEGPAAGPPDAGPTPVDY